MRIFNKTPLALGVAAGMAMLVASTGAQAISSGTDLNLSAHSRAGGMAGAAYTRPQEVSAAVAGNPATLTQFSGVNFNFGAALISITDLQVDTDTTLPAALSSLAFHAEHESDADNYIVPTLGLSLQVSPNLFIGLGLEADAGLGADYRDSPLQLFAGAFATANAAYDPVANTLLGVPITGQCSDPQYTAINEPLLCGLTGPVAAPLDVEVISFNANIAAGYKVSEDLSLGATVTIGFGLAQLGTVGTTTGFDAISDLVIDPLAGAASNNGTLETGGILSDWGGTTASVHDIGFGWTLGATYMVTDGITTSLTVKSPLEYKFQNILYADNNTTTGQNFGSSTPVKSDGWQDLDVEQPLEIIVGVAFEDVLMNNLLVELDVVYKNWGDADAYRDAWKDQYLVALGAQYAAGNWNFRAGYNYASPILRDNPESTLGEIYGLGNLPLGKGAASIDGVPVAAPIVEALATDFIDIVQMSLLPVIWEHTVTAGVGYNFTDAVSVDAFVAYAFEEEESRSLDIAALAADVGISLLAGATAIPPGVTGTQSSISVNSGSEIMVGLGINVALP
ncbi:MAG TPA: long-chain fatty acid transport protein [Cycloclasticus sp.]|jgi:long-chain fatty acid transport protein|nr:long-chain fatty acid transport protein [Cycloclasticus sp.]